MGRYDRHYKGEKRTEWVHIMLTPTERAELEQAAPDHGIYST
jgi:hypothetical protein